MTGAVALLAAAATAGAQAADVVSVVTPRYLQAGGAPEVAAAQVLAGSAPVPDGTLVAFTGSLGLRFEPAIAATLGGVADTSILPGRESGFARIDAATGAGRGSATVWVRPGPAASASLSAHPVTAVPGGRVVLAATVVDAFGNSADGDAVEWSATGGQVEPVQAWVERGSSGATLTAGPGPEVLARLSWPGGGASITVPVAGHPPPAAGAYLPWAATGAGACSNLVTNGGFATDADGDGWPDGWQLTSGGTSLAVVGSQLPRWPRALRLADLDGAGEASALQQWSAPRPGASAAVRLWLRGGVGTGLRVEVWTRGAIGGRPVRLPAVVTTLPSEPLWRLHTLALPVAPEGATTLALTGRGSGGYVEVTGVALEVCGSPGP
jgi:hypothetical protein